MRRDTFLKSMAALAVSGGLPLSAFAASNVKMMIPANPGGGWDGTGRALGKALMDAKVADTVTFENKGGAAGALGLAQFVNASKGDPNALMVMGAAMIARAVGVDPAKINYVAFRGGGEATAAILGGNVTIGGSGYSEFSEYIKTGKMKPIGVTSAARLKGIEIPTLKEQGIDVEIGNWRGVYGAPGITPAQGKALTDMVIKATQSKAWAEALEKNNWTPAVLSGDAFEKFVDDDFASLRATMVKSGMI